MKQQKRLGKEIQRAKIQFMLKQQQVRIRSSVKSSPYNNWLVHCIHIKESHWKWEFKWWFWTNFIIRETWRQVNLFSIFSFTRDAVISGCCFILSSLSVKTEWLKLERISENRLVQSPLLRAGSATALFSGPCSVSFWISPGRETPQPTQAACSSIKQFKQHFFS